MNATDFQKRLDRFSQLLVIQMPKINESVAMNAYALVRDRIVNSGVDGDGQSLGEYSEKQLPAFFFKEKSLNKSGDDAVEEAEAGTGTMSYKEFREANNRPTDHVTLSFSGDMWKDIGVVKEIVDETKIVTVVGGKNTRTRKSGKREVSTDDIIDGHYDHYGDFLEVNQEEEEMLNKTYDTLLQQLIDKSFE